MAKETICSKCLYAEDIFNSAARCERPQGEVRFNYITGKTDYDVVVKYVGDKDYPNDKYKGGCPFYKEDYSTGVY